eukprot:1259282-Pyramimonas_sp.AAC.1
MVEAGNRAVPGQGEKGWSCRCVTRRSSGRWAAVRERGVRREAMPPGPEAGSAGGFEETLW